MSHHGKSRTNFYFPEFPKLEQEVRPLSVIAQWIGTVVSSNGPERVQTPTSKLLSRSETQPAHTTKLVIPTAGSYPPLVFTYSHLDGPLGSIDARILARQRTGVSPFCLLGVRTITYTGYHLRTDSVEFGQPNITYGHITANNTWAWSGVLPPRSLDRSQARAPLANPEHETTRQNMLQVLQKPIGDILGQLPTVSLRQ